MSLQQQQNTLSSQYQENDTNGKNLSPQQSLLISQDNQQDLLNSQKQVQFSNQNSISPTKPIKKISNMSEIALAYSKAVSSSNNNASQILTKSEIQQEKKRKETMKAINQANQELVEYFLDLDNKLGIFHKKVSNKVLKDMEVDIIKTQTESKKYQTLLHKREAELQPEIELIQHLSKSLQKFREESSKLFAVLEMQVKDNKQVQSELSIVRNECERLKMDLKKSKIYIRNLQQEVDEKQFIQDFRSQEQKIFDFQQEVKMYINKQKNFNRKNSLYQKHLQGILRLNAQEFDLQELLLDTDMLIMDLSQKNSVESQYHLQSIYESKNSLDCTINSTTDIVNQSIDKESSIIQQDKGNMYQRLFIDCVEEIASKIQETKWREQFIQVSGIDKFNIVEKFCNNKRVQALIYADENPYPLNKHKLNTIKNRLQKKKLEINTEFNKSRLKKTILLTDRRQDSVTNNNNQNGKIEIKEYLQQDFEQQQNNNSNTLPDIAKYNLHKNSRSVSMDYNYNSNIIKKNIKYTNSNHINSNKQSLINTKMHLQRIRQLYSTPQSCNLQYNNNKNNKNKSNCQDKGEFYLQQQQQQQQQQKYSEVSRLGVDESEIQSLNEMSIVQP